MEQKPKIRRASKTIEVNGVYYPYGLGCYHHNNCFTCPLPDCKCSARWAWVVQKKTLDRGVRKVGNESNN